ncbi:Serine/threonine-protein kinase [Collariella sp. IMI 366227]|nr:Serine/threonine-protein kinase [Collariella sp. IMI 366227]
MLLPCHGYLTIGFGSYGEVKLIRKKQDGRVYALKRLNKHEMMAKSNAPYVYIEQTVLARSKSGWIVKLHAAFQTRSDLYLRMEYLPGGNLHRRLWRMPVLTEKDARFYAAEIALGIEALHGLNFIHRDIKPDNVLIDGDGHLRLADFGISKYVPPELKSSRDASGYATYTLRSPNLNKTFRSGIGRGHGYMAPEMEVYERYSFDTD